MMAIYSLTIAEYLENFLEKYTEKRKVVYNVPRHDVLSCHAEATRS